MRYLLGLAIAGLLTGWVLLLNGLDGVTAFWSRTIGYQSGRDSPFSIWGQYPGLSWLHLAVMAAVVLGAVAVLRWPRGIDLVQWAALSAAVLIGLELTLTHWFYLYIPWFLPLVLFVVVPEWPRRAREPKPAPRTSVPETPSEAIPA